MAVMGELLLARVFTPIAHWIDYRFHVNTYKVAGFLFQGSVMSASVFILISLLAFGEGRTAVAILGILFSGIWAMAGWGGVQIMARADRDYESNPGIYPKDAAIFVAGVRSFPFILFIGSMMFAFGISDGLSGDILRFLASPYIALHSMGDFFAAVPPSGRPRRESRPRLAPAPGAA